MHTYELYTSEDVRIATKSTVDFAAMYEYIYISSSVSRLHLAMAIVRCFTPLSCIKVIGSIVLQAAPATNDAAGHGDGDLC